jgi:phosphopantothenoylcysteine decarboxylase/phosphopantothenate--cysteine ligase
MDLDMYKHQSTKLSLQKLTSYNNKLIPAGTGELASGLVGEGRMAEPEAIVKYIEKDILNQLPLKGKQILITAGPTYEAIDPVRFIGNHSSGKMGFEIANAAANLGAKVVLVTGPTHQDITNDSVKVKPVVSAEEMYNEVHKYFRSSDIAILSAAVGDYRPKTIARQKIKKKEATFSIELEKTKDILKSLGEIKTTQFLVGFALETNNELEHAKGKLKSKHLDIIVLNSLQDKGAGFGGSTNKVTFITATCQVIEHELKSKAEVAKDLMQHILKQIDA